MNTQPVDLFFSAENVLDYFPPEDALTHMTTCEVLMCEKTGHYKLTILSGSVISC